MEIEESSLFREIEKIITGGVKPVHYTYNATLHIKGVDYGVLKVLSVDNIEDFEQNYAEVIMMRVMLLAGQYAFNIWPFQGKIDCTLSRSPIQEASDSVNQDELVQTERYTAVLRDTGAPTLEGANANMATIEKMDLSNMVEVDFQLVNKSLEQQRTIAVGGNFRNCRTDDVVKAVLTVESKRVQDVEKVRIPKGVVMVPGSNATKRDHVEIPQGIRLVDVPAYVHQRCGGIYNSGLGYYLKGDYWYVYPCYDTTRFNQSPNTLTVINVPKNKFPEVERTYRKDGTNLVILATGDIKFRDNTETMQLNGGNGVRFADADKFMRGWVSTKDNKAVASRGANNSEFIAVKRDNGNNLVHVADDAITSNPFKQYSEMAKAQGASVGLVWENAEPSLVFPGMNVKILYLENDEIKTTFGVLLKQHSFTHMRGVGLTDTRYTTHTTLSIFARPLDLTSA